MIRIAATPAASSEQTSKTVETIASIAENSGAVLMQRPHRGARNAGRKRRPFMLDAKAVLLSESSQRNEFLLLAQATKTGGRTWLAQLNISTLS
jgi:hypothetical protein